MALSQLLKIICHAIYNEIEWTSIRAKGVFKKNITQWIKTIYRDELFSLWMGMRTGTVSKPLKLSTVSAVTIGIGS